MVIGILKVCKNEQFGVDLIRRAAEEPLRMIAENAGHEGSIIVNKIKEECGPIGFNASTEKFCNLIECGVVDPTKVTRTALQNAISVSSLLLTTEALIADKVDKKKDVHSPMNRGGMGNMNLGGY